MVGPCRPIRTFPSKVEACVESSLRDDIRQMVDIIHVAGDDRNTGDVLDMTDLTVFVADHRKDSYFTLAQFL